MGDQGPLRELISLPDVQRLLGVSRAHVFRLMADGELTVVRLGRRTLVDPRDLDDLVERRKERSPQVKGPASNRAFPKLPIAPGAMAQASRSTCGWLVRASDLLAEPDSGPTPWLVDRLIVDRSLCACVGRWKVTKTWAMLEIAVAIVTGEPAFGELEIPATGPVVYVIEESGRDALWRRLDMLARGCGIDPGRLADLHLAPNERVKLDDQRWQDDLVESVAISARECLCSTRSPG
jgi:excisionase family DNA binding protein